MNVYGSVRLLRHLAGALEPGEAELLESLVGQNGDRITQVQAARLGAHGKADAFFLSSLYSTAALPALLSTYS